MTSVFQQMYNVMAIGHVTLIKTYKHDLSILVFICFYMLFLKPEVNCITTPYKCKCMYAKLSHETSAFSNRIPSHCSKKKHYFCLRDANTFIYISQMVPSFKFK